MERYVSTVNLSACQEYNPEATNAVAKREKKKPDGVTPATPSTEHGGQPGDRGRSDNIFARHVWNSYFTLFKLFIAVSVRSCST